VTHVKNWIAGFAVLMLAGAAAADEAPDKIIICQGCHGDALVSQNQNIPTLSGQQPGYVQIQLYLFHEGGRKAEGMSEVAQGLSDDDMRALASYLGSLPKPQPPAEAGDPARMAAAKALADKEHCNSCHNPDYSGHDNIPRIADQREDYLTKTMRDYKSNQRPGYDATMAEVMQPISDQQIVELAYYLAHFR
jgi:cytochrome c553